MKKHNGVISFWKFMFSMMIVIYHGTDLGGKNDYLFLKTGSIAVEFFFIVSGFLLAASALRKSDSNGIGKDTFNFIAKKVKAFFPYAFIAWLSGIVLLRVYDGIALKKSILSLYDLLLLRMGGFDSYVVVGADWYISAMLISMLVLYPLIRKYGKNFIYIASPLIVLLAGGYLNYKYGSLRTPTELTVYFYKGTLRAFFELNIGMIAYLIATKLSEFKFSRRGKIILTILEVVLFLIPFLISQFSDYATQYDYIMLIVLTVAIIIAFSEHTLGYNFFNNKFVFYLERLSLPLYLYHSVVRSFIKRARVLKGCSYPQKLIILIILSIIISMILLKLVDYVREKNYLIK